jgi:centrosomal protein CEP104
LLDPTVSCLFEKLADGNARIREGARKGIDALVASQNIGPAVVGAHALRAMPKQAGAWRPLTSRLQLLNDLVLTYGLGGHTGLIMETIMNFIKSSQAFAHSNAEVRDAAKFLTVAIQKVTGTPPLAPYLKDLRKKQMDEYLAAFEGGVVPTGAAAGAAVATAATAAGGQAKQTNPAGKGGGGKAASKAEEKESPQKKQNGQAANQSKNQGQGQGEAKKGGGKGGATESGGGAAAGGGNSLAGTDHYADEKFEEEAVDFTTCMFCSEANRDWNEDALDLHYWKDCALLSPCPACAQVVEIAGLPEHLLDECEQKASYVPCEVTGTSTTALLYCR